MTKKRLDQILVQKQLASTRSQAENYIKLGYVTVDKKVVTKPGMLVSQNNELKINIAQQYVSRAGLKLASVADKLGLGFKDKVVLDVGSSTGGFTDYALRNSAQKVIAVDVGSNQMHVNLRQNSRLELHEGTDIRHFKMAKGVDVILVDVSFISLREILPGLIQFCEPDTQIVAMVKPQFEIGAQAKNKGVVKNDTLRRQILKDFEVWAKKLFTVVKKSDSEVAGAKGNLERFYLLRVAL